MYGSKMRPTTVGLDFDDTVTTNPAMFVKIVNIFQEHGYDVYIVTARNKNGWCPKLRAFQEETGLTVIFTGAKAKQDVVEMDIWIDDFPLAITHDFKETRWQASEETQNNLL